MEAVITKAEAEEQAKMVQYKLVKGMKQEDRAEVLVMETDKAKLGKYYRDRTGHGRNPDE